MKACIMYISSDDKRPVCAKEDSWEFEHRIDADGISKDDSYYVKWLRRTGKYKYGKQQ